MLDIIGELGGVHEIILIGISLMIGPIAHFSFIMKSAKHLFYARTFDSNIFSECGTCKVNKLEISGLLNN